MDDFRFYSKLDGMPLCSLFFPLHACTDDFGNCNLMSQESWYARYTFWYEYT